MYFFTENYRQSYSHGFYQRIAKCGYIDMKISLVLGIYQGRVLFYFCGFLIIK